MGARGTTLKKKLLVGLPFSKTGENLDGLLPNGNYFGICQLEVQIVAKIATKESRNRSGADISET